MLILQFVRIFLANTLKWSGLGMEWGVVGLKGWCNPQAMWLRKKM
jgi:hypothetical protein